jgi:lysyl-tRNA synthetase class 2
MRAIALPVLPALGFGAATVGLVDLAAAATPSPVSLVDRAAIALGAPPADRPGTAVLGFGALALAYGLIRRRRLAWWFAAVLLVGLGMLALPGHPVRLVLLASLLGVLLFSRHEFGTGPDPRRLRIAAGVGAAGVGLTLAWAVFSRMAYGSVGVRHLVLLGGVGALAIAVVAFSPAPAPAPGTPRQRATVRTLANHTDADSLAPFATRRDKSYVLSPDGRAAIGYRVVLGTALAAGDPVGQADGAPGAISAYLEMCRRHGWRPAVIGASTEAAALWRANGLRGLVLGDEAVLDVAAFSLQSRRMRNVRQAVARTGNAGVTVHIGPMTPALAASLRPVLDDWLGGRRVRGFSMNLDRMLTVRRDVLVAVARGGTGEAVAFARFAVCADGRTLTLDVAPRRRDAPNGVVERLIVEVVEHARTIGAREVSLNFAAFRRVFEADGWLARLVSGLAHATDRWVELRPLYRFCAKFHPTWRARHLMLRSWWSLGPVGVAALVTELRPNRR